MAKNSNFVWAMDSRGRVTKCFAQPENRGIGRCDHEFHQEEGQTLVEFLSEHGLDIKSDSIFDSDYVKLSQFHLTDEEKDKLPEITTKQGFLEEYNDGAWFHLDNEQLWTDMDKKCFAEISGMDVKDINALLQEEKYAYLDKCKGHKIGDLRDKDDPGLKKIKGLKDLQDENGEYLVTGVAALNCLAEQHNFEATKDVYVIPYYMRQGIPSEDSPTGQINSDITDSYIHVFTTSKSDKYKPQKAFEELINNTSGRKSKNSFYAKRSIADLMSGKKGVFRGELTGYTIPYTGRAVAIPNTKIERDEAVIPARMAKDIFRPTIIKGLEDRGFNPQQINEFFKNTEMPEEEIHPMTRNIMNDIITEANVRVIINRQPSLHAPSMQGLRPKIGDKPAIETHPIIAAGMNLDFDGDTLACYGINNNKMAKLVDKELHPDNFKNVPRHQEDLLMKPTKDAKLGIMNILKKRTN